MSQKKLVESKKVSSRLNHASPPQEDPPSMFARQLLADVGPQVPKLSVDDEARWQFPVVPTEQTVSTRRHQKESSQLNFELLVKKRESDIQKQEDLRRDQRRFLQSGK